MKLTSKKLSKEDVPFFQDLIKDSPEWVAEECTAADIYSYLKAYQDGVWNVWLKDGCKVGVSYYIEQARSNNRAWIGTVLVSAAHQFSGIGKAIIELITKELKQKGHKVVYAAVPILQNKWIRFLSSCQFEQYKIEKEPNKTYLLFVKPIEA